MPLLPLLALAVAQAQPAPASLTITCAPAQASARLMGLLSESRSLFSLAGTPAAALLALPSEPETARAAGVDLAGPLVFHRSPAGTGARVRLIDPAAGQAALTALGLAPTLAAGGGWTVQAPDGGRWTASVAGADLVVGDPTPTDAPAPEQPGCRLSAMVGDRLGAIDATLPASPDAPIVVGLQPPQPPPPALSRTRGAPVPGTSTAPPFAVATVGVPLLELAADLAGRDGLGDALKAEDVRQLSRILRMEPGATLAVWMEGGAPRFAASVPVRGGRGQALRPRAVTRQLRRRLRQEPQLTVDRRGPSALRVVAPGKPPLEVVVQPDRLLVGNAARAVAESAGGVGQPWVDADFVGFAAQAPVAVEARLDRTRLPLPVSGPLRLGLRADGPRLEVLLAGGADGMLVPQLLFLTELVKATQGRAIPAPPRPARPELEP